MIYGNNLSSELKWDSIRGERNRILSESDWTQLSDSVVDKLLWANYRQLLRDIPQNFQSPDSVVWPTRPE